MQIVMLVLMFILGGLLSAGIMATLYVKKTHELQKWEKRFKETDKELQTFKLMPQPTITMYRGDMIPIECSIAFDRRDFDEIPSEWLENEIVRKLSEGIKPYIETVVTDDFYKTQKVVRGKVIVVADADID